MLAPSFPADSHHLYLNHHRWLQNLLRRKLGNAFDAADLAHDVFEKVFRQGALNLINEPRAYLTTIANRTVSNHWRAREIERICLETMAVLADKGTATLEQALMLKQILLEIDALLGRLKPKARQAFLLYQLDDLTYAQIADQLGVSERMVKHYMAQAMRECLGSSLWDDAQSVIHDA